MVVYNLPLSTVLCDNNTNYLGQDIYRHLRQRTLKPLNIKNITMTEFTDKRREMYLDV